MKYLLSIAAFVLVISPLPLSAQSPGTMTSFGFRSNTFVLHQRDTLFQLPKEFIMEGSERILVDSTSLLRRLFDYQIDYRFGRILFSPAQLARIVADTLLHRITVTYRTLPINFKHDYALRQIEVRRDSVSGQRTVSVRPSGGFLSDDVF